MAGYKVKTYVRHGYFEYEVKEREQAVAHGHAIMESGVYRRAIGNNAVEFHKPYKVKIEGEDLGSEYMDKFCRT